ncbi:MAG: Deoxycytidine triphosphate deaminase [Candidatus Woesebacteria bacterium GW2011_GWA1_37_8]|uniref:Deoxycytidine triphosphate deaminase n=2 Tax=Candidatus Woeseibacteriota TaxID=1752722 RepID=A0A0G0L5W1_9BACT|nr:MAG: deoxycytidine triphosphate deaminase, dCTP deaminase [Microgenomates group bacterium GW2011_GWC1_37_12b]KKQ45653.1 MAG: Deoxycytidine triphosphate deaminase [Candidatus Woesebacteria bacterium GW2011_GWA1_37_8]KKQ86417.1 MAG: Deoxycytidine triphosphate deaminase [Candidatus Woesebacteria bacterium GW2011_GWB1_38_8b]
MKTNKKKTTPNIYGTLPDFVLKDFIKRKIIKIKNLSKNWQSDLDQVSIDMHLGKRIMIPTMGRHIVIDTKVGVNKEMYELLVLNYGDSFILRPGQFVIAETAEDITLPDDIIGRLEGKSSLARLGVVIHQTSARFDPGWSGPAALEIKNNSDNDVIIYCGGKICAFSFERLMTPVERPYKKTTKRYHKNQTLHSMIQKDKLMHNK